MAGEGVQGTITKYLTKALNTPGMGSPSSCGGSKRCLDMVEDGMTHDDVEYGSQGAQAKKLKLSNMDLKPKKRDAKSKTWKRPRSAKKTVVGVGGGYQDIRMFWNGTPRGVGEGLTSED